jgi:hypothetical protein
MLQVLESDWILVVVCVFPHSTLSTVLLIEAGAILDRLRPIDRDDELTAGPCFAVPPVIQSCCLEGSESITRGILRGRTTPVTTKIENRSSYFT